MATKVPLHYRIGTAASWPVGLLWTSLTYIWRTTPLHRRELNGSFDADMPPPYPSGVDLTGVQFPEDGSGPLFRRSYEGRVADTAMTPEVLMAHLGASPDTVAPRALAKFRKTQGSHEAMRVGDEFLVHMPGPWDGPIRCIEVTDTSFRFATLDGHLEAGQIEWSAGREGELLRFRIESWARAGDRLSAIAHDRLRMAKEVQLHMWSSVVERVARFAGGRLERGVDIETRRVDPDAFTGPDAPRAAGRD